MKRISQINRKTRETNIEIKLNIDGTGKYSINTPIGFLNHMLELFSRHGLFDIEIKASGDMKVDEHHTVEDTGIVLGQCFNQAIGEKKGIKRYGFFILPMDEVLVTVAVDFAGRTAFNMQCQLNREKVGDLPTELVYDFWDAFAQNAGVNLFIKTENGRNDHHQIEGIFKCVAKAIRMACEFDSRNINNIPTTKGKL